jgi:hypothetical protein
MLVAVVEVEWEPGLVYEVSLSCLGLVFSLHKEKSDICRMELFALAMALLEQRAALSPRVHIHHVAYICDGHGPIRS